jgi:hypothetical protein
VEIKEMNNQNKEFSKEYKGITGKLIWHEI